jgi:hypothetical protein
MPKICFLLDVSEPIEARKKNMLIHINPVSTYVYGVHNFIFHITFNFPST